MSKQLEVERIELSSLANSILTTTCLVLLDEDGLEESTPQWPERSLNVSNKSLRHQPAYAHTKLNDDKSKTLGPALGYRATYSVKN